MARFLGWTWLVILVLALPHIPVANWPLLALVALGVLVAVVRL